MKRSSLLLGALAGLLCVTDSVWGSNPGVYEQYNTTKEDCTKNARTLGDALTVRAETKTKGARCLFILAQNCQELNEVPPLVENLFRKNESKALERCHEGLSSSGDLDFVKGANSVVLLTLIKNAVTHTPWEQNKGLALNLCQSGVKNPDQEIERLIGELALKTTHQRPMHNANESGRKNDIIVKNDIKNENHPPEAGGQPADSLQAVDEEKIDGAPEIDQNDGKQGNSTTGADRDLKEVRSSRETPPAPGNEPPAQKAAERGRRTDTQNDQVPSDGDEAETHDETPNATEAKEEEHGAEDHKLIEEEDQEEVEEQEKKNKEDEKKKRQKEEERKQKEDEKQRLEAQQRKEQEEKRVKEEKEKAERELKENLEAEEEENRRLEEQRKKEEEQERIKEENKKQARELKEKQEKEAKKKEEEKKNSKGDSKNSDETPNSASERLKAALKSVNSKNSGATAAQLPAINSQTGITPLTPGKPGSAGDSRDQYVEDNGSAHSNNPMLTEMMRTMGRLNKKENEQKKNELNKTNTTTLSETEDFTAQTQPNNHYSISSISSSPSSSSPSSSNFSSSQNNSAIPAVTPLASQYAGNPFLMGIMKAMGQTSRKANEEVAYARPKANANTQGAKATLTGQPKSNANYSGSSMSSSPSSSSSSSSNLSSSQKNSEIPAVTPLASQYADNPFLMGMMKAMGQTSRKATEEEEYERTKPNAYTLGATGPLTEQPTSNANYSGSSMSSSPSSRSSSSSNFSSSQNTSEIPAVTPLASQYADNPFLMGMMEAMDQTSRKAKEEEEYERTKPNANTLGAKGTLTAQPKSNANYSGSSMSSSPSSSSSSSSNFSSSHNNSNITNVTTLDPQNKNNTDLMELMTKMSSIIAKKTEKKDNEKNTTTTTALGGKVDFQPKPDGNYSNSSMSGSPLTSGPASPSSSPSSLILTNTMSDVTNKKRQELINRVNQMTTTLQRKLSDVTSNMKSSNMSNQDLLRTLETLKNYTRTMRNNLIALSIETHQLNSEEIEISKLKQEVEEAKKELNKLNEELAQQLQEMYGN